jgi:valyl-tRNA synthetase
VALTRYPRHSGLLSSAYTVGGIAMQNLQQVIQGIRARRKELGVPEKETVPAKIAAVTPILTFLKTGPEIIEKLANVSELELVLLDDRNTREEYSNLAWQAISTTELFVDYQRQIDVPAERDRLTKDIAKYEKGLVAAESKLGNEGFLAKAPAHIVDGLKKQEAETRLLLEKTRAALEALPK